MSIASCFTKLNQGKPVFSQEEMREITALANKHSGKMSVAEAEQLAVQEMLKEALADQLMVSDLIREAAGIEAPSAAVRKDHVTADEVAEAPGVETKPETSVAATKPESSKERLDRLLRNAGVNPDAPMDKAASLRREAEKLMKESSKILDGIQPGQPILSTRDRNLREKSIEKARKASDLYAQAEAIDTSAKPSQEPKVEQPAGAQTDFSTIAGQSDIFERARSGDITADEFKAAFAAVLNNKDAFVAELSALTKPQLLEKYPGLQYRYKNEKKADVVKAAYDGLLSRYSLGEGISYSMGKGSYERAIAAMVDGTTDDALAEYAASIKRSADERESARAEALAGMENPETLEDFNRLLRAKAADMGEGVTFQQVRMELPIEHRIKFDELAAEKSRAERASRKTAQQEQSIRAPGEPVTATEIIKTKHTKHGHDLWQFNLEQRVSGDEFKSLVGQAKRLGGDYSSYRGNGAIPGWQFRTEEAAKAFKALIAGDTAQAKDVMQARRDAYADDRSQTAVERLTEMADALDEKADDILGADRKANTARRARFAASAEAAANSDKAMAQTMRNIAQALTDGSAKLLDRVRQKVQVEMLQGMVRTAQDDMQRAKYPTYAEQERHKGEKPTREVADYAQFPNYTVFRSDLANLGRALLETDGTKKLGQRLMKVADDVSDAYLTFAKDNLHKVSAFSTQGGGIAAFASKGAAEAAIERSGYRGTAIVLPVKRNENLIVLSPSEAIKRGVWEGDHDKRITLSGEFGEELVEKIGKAARRGTEISVPWQFENAYDKRKRLAGMNIETPAEMRAALREFIGLRQAAAAPDKIKVLERAMVGRRNDGLDFFPTPAAVADEMIEAAGIEEGMSVLEPSAGMGHIADRIRAAGAEPDVVELAGDRRELLEAKGYNLVGSDFMDMDPRSFTYGDTFRAPDGKEGIMRGAGGLGSGRVRLVDDNGDALGYYDRDELVEVRKNGSSSGYDRIMMNPPFGDRRDALHVQHAYDLLKPGGKLVAIMGEGVFFGKDTKAQGFRDWLESVGGTEEKLEQGTFLDPSLPVNTGVSARMVVIDKSETDKGLALLSLAKSASSGGVGLSLVNRVISNVLAAKKSWNVEVFGFLDFDALPADVQERTARQYGEETARKAKGIVHGGKVYVIAENNESEADVETTILHEVEGHVGIHRLYGQDIIQKLNTLYRDIGGYQGLKRIVERRGIKGDISEYVAAMEETDSLTDEQKLAVIMDEVLAYHAQSPRFGDRVKTIVGAIRAWLRDNGFAKLAEHGETDLLKLLSDGRKQLMKAGKGADATVMMVAGHRSPQTVDSITKATATLRAHWNGFHRINIVQSVREVPNDIYLRALRALKPIGQKTEGVYDPKTNSVYLIADNIASQERAVWVAAHEVAGHGGLRMLDQSVAEALDFAGKNVFVNKLAQAIAADREETFSAEEHTDEAVSELAAATITGNADAILDRYGVKVPAGMRSNMLGMVTRLLTAVRTFIAKMIGKPAESVSDGDVLGMLKQMKAAVEGVEQREVQRDSGHAMASRASKQQPSRLLRMAKAASMNKDTSLVDKAMSAPFKLLGWNRIVEPAVDRLLERAGEFVPERIKAGMLSDYGLGTDYTDRKAEMKSAEAAMSRKSAGLVEMLAALTRAESRVAYQWMQVKPDAATEKALLEQLPADSRDTLANLKALISNMGKEAVRLGQMSHEAYERNNMAYLHRTYAKHVLEPQGAISKMLRARALRIKGSQYKGRGIFDEVGMNAVGGDPSFWRKTQEGQADKSLVGEKVIRFERRDASTEAMDALPGMISKPMGKLREVIYWPSSQAVPAKFGDWVNAGTFEVRGTKGDKLVVWRDYTPEERQRMGELDEVRYAVAQTLQMMTHDIEVGRFFEWTAKQYGKIKPEGKEASASESMLRAYNKDEWVQVPAAKIPNTQTMKYGALAGLYIPAPVWNDIRQTAGTRIEPLGHAHEKVLQFWKKAKTAWSPAVHMNNVMANFVIADWHDLRSSDLFEALKVWAKNNKEGYREIYQRFEDSGALGGMFLSNEALRDEIAKQLDAMKAELTGEVEAKDEMTRMAKVMHLFTMAGMVPAKGAKVYTTHMEDAYQFEDAIFRLAAFVKAIRYGKSDIEAGRIARHSFLNYDINAPWVQAARHTALPFVSFFYRALPMALNTVKSKPWKILKLLAFWQIISILGTLGSGGDDDEERKLLPKEKQGRVWGVVPKMVRMPWNHDDAPYFLDIRRFVPVGDIADNEMGSGMLPPWATPGGPLVMLAEVLLANKSFFTEKEIVQDTDSQGERLEKRLDHLIKGMLPNVPLPNPLNLQTPTGEINPLGLSQGSGQSYAWSAIEKSLLKREGSIGEVRNTPAAIASAFGIKASAFPERNMQAAKQIELNKQVEEIKDAMRKIQRNYGNLEKPTAAEQARFELDIRRQSEKIAELTAGR